MTGQDVSVWHLVTVAPQLDLKTAEALKRLGFRVWAPVKRKEVKRARNTKGKWMIRIPMMRGYLFIGFREEGPSWETIFLNELRVRVMYSGASPVAFDDGGFHAVRRNVVEALREESRVRAVMTRPPKKGERVSVRISSLISKEAKIVEVEGETAIGLMEMLGVERAVSIPLDAIARAA